MAVDMAWLEGVRKQNRVRFGMSGLGQAGDVERLVQEIEARKAQKFAREAAAVEETAVAAPSYPSLPPLSLPPPPQIPKSVLVVGGVVVVGLLGLIAYSVFSRK